MASLGRSFSLLRASRSLRPGRSRAAIPPARLEFVGPAARKFLDAGSMAAHSLPASHHWRDRSRHSDRVQRRCAASVSRCPVVFLVRLRQSGTASTRRRAVELSAGERAEETACSQPRIRRRVTAARDTARIREPRAHRLGRELCREGASGRAAGVREFPGRRPAEFESRRRNDRARPTRAQKPERAKSEEQRDTRADQRSETPSPGPSGKRITPSSIVAPTYGSFATSAAPS